MKKITLQLLIIIWALLFIGCTKDSQTPCVPITCINGGISTPECGCNCPQGFTGSDCSTQITPAKITITKIRVKFFPLSTNTGGFWDVTGLNATNARPDIFVTMLNSSFTEIYKSQTYYPNVISDGITYYDFVPATPISITSVNSLSSNFILNLWDYDGADSNINDGVDDNMGFTSFYVYNSTQGFPSTITVGNTSTPIIFELTLSYIW